MNNVFGWIKAHPMWIAIGGAGFLGILAYAYMHKGSGQTQQDLLVAPATGSGPTPATTTTQITNGPSGSIQPISGIDPVSPVGPISPQITTVTPVSPDAPITPFVNPGGLATPNPPAPISPYNGHPVSGLVPSPKQPATLGQTTQFSQPTSVNAVAPQQQLVTSQLPSTSTAFTAKNPFGGAYNTKTGNTSPGPAASPQYVGTPLGPGTPVISAPSQAAANRMVQTTGGQNVKLAAANAGKGGLAGNPSMYG